MAEEAIPSRSKGKRLRCENQFDFSFNEDDFEELTKGHCPHNTNSSSKWSLSNFSEWIGARCKEESRFSTTADILLTDNNEKLCECLCKYAVETRRKMEHIIHQEPSNSTNGVTKAYPFSKSWISNHLYERQGVYKAQERLWHLLSPVSFKRSGYIRQ